MAAAQDKSPIRKELQNIVFDKEKTLDFINRKLSVCNYNIEELRVSENPFSMLKFNWELASQSEKYNLFGLPIDNVYGYIPNDESKYCLYFTIEVDKRIIENFIKAVGNPENVDQEQLKSGNYDFLIWYLPEIQMFINNANSLGRVSGNCLITITNIDYRKLAIFDN